MNKRLKGKVAIVTGSGQGVGRGIAIVLAREGAKVITNNRQPHSKNDRAVDLNLDENERKKVLALQGDAESTANKIISEGGEAISFYGNVADYDVAGKLIQKAIDTYGRIDILVNNAAVTGSAMLTETTEELWDVQTLSKLKGTFNCMRHAVPYMIKQKFGRVVNVSSDAWVGLVGLAAYSAANSGIVGLTKATAKELHTLGVTVNVICPAAASPGHSIGFSKLTKVWERHGVKISKELLKHIEETHGPAENMAPFIFYLATEEAAYISGAVFSITASGQISLYSDPVKIQAIKKDNSPWTVDELIEVVPAELIKDYKSTANQLP